MNLTELMKLKKAELTAMAKELGLRRYSKLKKAELAAMIAKERASEPETTAAQEGLRLVAEESSKAETLEGTDRLDQLSEEIHAARGAVVPGTDIHQETLRSLDAGLPGLPETALEDRVELLPRDPGWMHTYWTLSRSNIEAIHRSGADRFRVRLYDCTDPGGDRLASVTPVDPWHRSAYIQVPASGRAYRAEIGLKDNGDFRSFGLSGVIVAPAAGPSATVDDHFVTIPWGTDLRDLDPAAVSHPRVRPNGSGVVEPSGGEGSEAYDPRHFAGSSSNVAGSWRLDPDERD
jgi:hypothetical protein